MSAIKRLIETTQADQQTHLIHFENELKTFADDKQFIMFVNLIADENEDFFIIGTRDQAEKYIENYCDNWEMYEFANDYEIK
jgi:ribosomal protein S2